LAKTSESDYATPIEQHLFVFSFVIEGSTEKVLQFIMALKSIYNKKLRITEQKMYSRTIHRGLINIKSFN
jgi:hypothetical protein